MSATASKAHYYVVYDGDWKIQCDGENSEPYPRRYDALRDAVGLAHLDVRNGRDVDVIVQDHDGFHRSGIRPAIRSRRRWCPRTERFTHRRSVKLSYL